MERDEVKDKKILSTALGLVIAVAGVLGLVACGSDGEPGGETSVNESASVDVTEDLENARQTILDVLADDDSWSQIMLASDVQQPTVKYGLLVVPYSYSDAASRVQSTITITNGEFAIDADSAATGQTWRIDQEGTITEVTE